MIQLYAAAQVLFKIPVGRQDLVSIISDMQRSNGYVHRRFTTFTVEAKLIKRRYQQKDIAPIIKASFPVKSTFEVAALVVRTSA